MSNKKNNVFFVVIERKIEMLKINEGCLNIDIKHCAEN